MARREELIDEQWALLNRHLVSSQPSNLRRSKLSPQIPNMGQGRTAQAAFGNLAEDLRARENLDLSECFIDGTFAVAKKKELKKLEIPSGARVTTQWADDNYLGFLHLATSRFCSEHDFEMAFG